MASEVSVKWCTSENNKWVALSENLRSGSQLGLTFLFFISPSISWQFMSMSVPQSCPPTASNMLSFCRTIAHHVESQPGPASSLAGWLAGWPCFSKTRNCRRLSLVALSSPCSTYKSAEFIIFAAIFHRL